MKYIYFILFVLSSNFIFGQVTASTDTNYKYDVLTSSEIISEITIYNNGANDTIIWTRYDVDIPDGWFSAACDEEVCYFPETSTGTTIIAQGDSAKFRTYFYHESIEGTGSVNFSFKTKNNLKDSLVVNFVGNASVTGLFEKSLSKRSVFYPTVSTNGSFFSNEDVKRVKVLNSNGIELFTNEASNITSIDLSAYNKGVYYLVIDNIGTQRVMVE